MSQRSEEVGNKEWLESGFQIDIKDFADIRRHLIENVPPPRRVLYIGMHQAWQDPLTIVDASEVVAVDGAYQGMALNDDQVEEKRDELIDKGDAEAIAWLISSTDIKRIGNEMTFLTQHRPEIQYQDNGVVSLQGRYKGVDRSYTMLPRTIEEHAEKDTCKYPVVMLKRTFPAVTSWPAVLQLMEPNGYLFTTGYSYQKGLSHDTTRSGTGIDNSPLPLFYPPELIGLKAIIQVDNGAYTLYQKVEDVDPEVVIAIINAGTYLDDLVNIDMISNVIQESTINPATGATDTFVPVPREDIPIFWSEKQLQEYLYNGLNLASNLISDADFEQVIQSVLDRIKQVREDVVFSEAIYEYKQRFYDAAGYLENNQTLSQCILDYLKKV
ncbi:MAG TPA: hypothetical protein VK338_01590, partial [Candidatus Nitrosocosmicus sp.]|nr:hypothetical protein [Candidatus Nitrosocosmicus sp.]